MLRIPLPAALVEQARAYASGELTPVEPRNAATVVLVRPGTASDGPEVYLLRRQASMAFAAGMCVFPGGGVDPRDFDHAVAWAGPSPASWAERLGTDEAMARALVCAAVRETFEESGVLLAGPRPRRWSRTRPATTGRPTGSPSRGGRCRSPTSWTQRGLVLRTDLLGAWSGWLTPVFEPRRYRTWFFVAALPAGPADPGRLTESSSVTWMGALDAASAVDAGELLMLPPTYLTCLEVGLHSSPREVLAAAAAAAGRDLHAGGRGAGDSASLSIPERLRTLVEQRLS